MTKLPTPRRPENLLRLARRRHSTVDERPSGLSDRLGLKTVAVAALLVVVLPLVPFLLVVWGISRTLDGVTERVSWE